MSFLAKFILDDQEMNVLECVYEFHQKVDYSGRPIETPRSGLIKLVLESTSNTNLLSWMISVFAYRDGEIVFLKRDTASASKKLTFKDGICVEFKEVFNASSQIPMRTYISISADAVGVDDVVLDNSWQTNNN